MRRVDAVARALEAHRPRIGPHLAAFGAEGFHLLLRVGTHLVEVGQVVAPERLEGLAWHLAGLAGHPSQGLLQVLVHGQEGFHHAAGFRHGALR